MTQNLYISLIHSQLPKLKIETARHFVRQYYDYLFVNQTWVFKFPRYREGAGNLSAEVDLLKKLQGRLSLAVPHPEVTLLEPPVPGLVFLGYPVIPGEPIDPEYLNASSGEIQEYAASQIAQFLRELHAIHPIELPARLPGGLQNTQVSDTRPYWEKMYAEVREKLFPAMRPDARRQISDHFEAYLDDPILQNFTPCLRHGDLGAENILWEPGTGKCNAVIDFSSAVLGDPAVDLASISTLGNDFFLRLARYYQADDSFRALLLSRAKFYYGTYALEEALHGHKSGDQIAYQNGMQAYI